MRKLSLLCLLAVLPLLLRAQGAPGFPFFKGPFQEMKMDALTTGKPMLLIFYTDWCGACLEMLKKTLADPSLQKYAKAEYLTFLIDAESLEPDGVELAREYGVLFFPTLIFLNETGEELKRESGFQTASHLLGELKRYRFVKAPSTSYQPAVSGRSLGPAPAVATPPPPLPLRPISAQSTPPPAPGLYRLSVKQLQYGGYGAQTGLFSDYANLLKAALKLEEMFPGQVLVQVNASGNSSVFKLILGPFGSRVAAQDAADRCKTLTGMPGFVVELGK